VPCVVVGLPGARGPLGDAASKPLTDVAPLVGGDALNPCEDAGDRTGDGERFAVVVDRLMRCMASLLFSACSA